MSDTNWTLRPDWTLRRNPHGRLEWLRGDVAEEVTPVRAFPLAAPDEGISLVGSDGHERAWIDRLDSLAPESRVLLEAELGELEFMPHILQIVSVATFSTPSAWQVRTDRGETTLVLEGEEDIRRLPAAPGGNALLITDSQGIAFLVPDSKALDRGSRKLLERFL